MATAILSIALAPLRTILPPGFVRVPHFEGEMFVLRRRGHVQFWQRYLASRGCCPASKLIPLGVGWLFYCGLLTAAEFGALVAVLGPPSPSEGPFAVGLFFYVLNVSQWRDGLRLALAPS